MSGASGTLEKQKAANPVTRHSTSGTLWDRDQQGSGLLRRQCACGTHAIAGGECSTCRHKRESSLQRTAITIAPDNNLLSDPAENHTFPKSGFAQDFSRV